MNINKLIKCIISKRFVLIRNYRKGFDKNTINGKIISKDNYHLQNDKFNHNNDHELFKNKINISKIISGEESDPANNVAVNPSDFKERYENEKRYKKEAIIRKKLLKDSKPFMNILSQRAKEQLFYLFNEKQMPIHELVENFPLIYKYCEYLVKNPLPILTIKDLIKDNESVINRLTMIKNLHKKNKLDKYREFIWIVEEDKYSLVQYANGNAKFEFPLKSQLELKEEYESSCPIGEMESLLDVSSFTVNNSYLPVVKKNSKSELEEQEKKMKYIISYFRPETEIIKEKMDSLTFTERPPLRLPNKASVDYSDLFRYKILSH